MADLHCGLVATKAKLIIYLLEEAHFESINTSNELNWKQNKHFGV